MSFYNVYKKYKNLNFEEIFEKTTKDDVLFSLNKENKNHLDFLHFLSYAALDDEILELMARAANELTLRYFGKTISLFTPLYLSNICDNGCIYCGFNHNNKIQRAILNYEQLEEEARYIRDEGIEHIIILTGENRKATPPEYIASCVKILKKYIQSISIEVYSLTLDEYKMLFKAGVDGFTMFQETYNEELYPHYHPVGEKANYKKRLDSPELAAKAGFHTVNIGALLGLDDFRKDSFFTGMHALYLQNNYSGADVCVSLPRICEHQGETHFTSHSFVSDKELVLAMLAYRIFLPRLGITISTRERASFRDNLIGLGVTKMSASSNTTVGGRSFKKSDAQFEVTDKRSLKELATSIKERGFQPIFKDWSSIR